MPANINTSLSPNNNFKIEHILLASPAGVVLDITSELLSFSMIETLDDVTSGTMVLQNRSNLTGIMKAFTGQEAIQIGFASGDGNDHGFRTLIEKTFRCNNIGYMSDCASTSPNSAISIELVSNYDIVNETNRINKNYSLDKSITDIVTDIIKTYYPDTEYNVEKTVSLKHPFSLTISKPYNVLKTLTNLAVSSEYKSSDFRLFENTKGLNFVTTGNLLSAEPKFTFGIPTSGQALNAGAGNFIPIYKLDGFMLADPKHNYKGATFGSNVMTTSIIDKEFDFTTLNRGQFDKLRPYSNEISTLSEYESAMQGQETFNTNLLYSKDSIYNILTQDDGGHKANLDLMEKTRMNSKRIMISAPGFTDLTAGDVVNLVMMNIDNGDRTKSALNTNLSGKWLITSIKYDLTLTEFNSDYTLVSDSNIKG